MKDVITLRSLESKNGAIPRSETWHSRGGTIRSIWTEFSGVISGLGARTGAMTKTIRCLERGLQVLRALNATPISSLRDVHRLTGIPKPTLLRILLTLEQSGAVSRRLADGRYRISANL